MIFLALQLFLQMVLLGLNPDDCLQAARRGISFWQSQSILQLNTAENSVQATRSQIVEMQSHYEDKVAGMNREIFNLREECHRESRRSLKYSRIANVNRLNVQI